MCMSASLSQSSSQSKEAYGYVASSTAFPHTCVVEKTFLTSTTRNMWPLISFLARAQHFFWPSFWSIFPQGTTLAVQSGVQLSSTLVLVWGREQGWISPVTMMKKQFTIGIFSFLIQFIHFLLTVSFLFNYISSYKSFALGSSSGDSSTFLHVS